MLEKIQNSLDDPVALTWLTIGLIGQGLFFSRFIIQWILSERKKESFIPISFWYFSIAGSLMLLAYSIHIQDPIFILGFTFNNVIYIRNLMLIRNKKNGAKEV